MKTTRKRFRLPAAAGAGLVLLALIACQPTVFPIETQPDAAETQAAPADTPSATAAQPEPSQEEVTPEATLLLEGLTPMPAGTSVSIPSTAEAAVAAAKGDLADRLGVAGEEILVTSIEAVEWSDSSLGCPRPGMMYLQVITPGFRVMLQAQGQAYEYHTDQGRNAVLCDGKSLISPAPLPVTVEPGLEGLVDQAKKDLAQRLGVNEKEILVTSIEAVQWSDTSLGCPQPGMMYAQVLTPGFEIVLEAEGQEYEYHTDSDRLAVLCADQPQASLDPPAGSRLPIFVEMVQSSLLPDSPARMPPADANPTGVFAFDPSSRLLRVQSSIQILSTTEVLVGLTTANMPNRPHVAIELFQIPSSQTTPLSVIAIEADSGTLTLAYADQTFELGPGQNRTFKQEGAGELAAIEITTITNHGRPAAIDVLPADPGSR